jgi:SAM-dependent methyltransferase
MGVIKKVTRKLKSFIKHILGIQDKKKPRGVWNAPENFFPDREDLVGVFTKIYSENVWGENHSSGRGSSVEVASPYMDFLQNFLNEYQITSVIDFGCGDWQFSRFINWDGIDYLGIDLVDSVITTDIARFQREKIKFLVSDLLNTGFKDLPKADLFIAKDVFQHLSNKNIKEILKGISTKEIKFALITNDYTDFNIDISNGDIRPLNLIEEPFCLKNAVEVFQFGGKRTYLIHFDQTV